ncbi:hypothetical protein ACS0TY_036151 [Phlomoides rotata]
MHLCCFELARDAVNTRGFSVIGGYMSPVNDLYKKKASQTTYQRTLTVLCREWSCSRWLVSKQLITENDVCHFFVRGY